METKIKSYIYEGESSDSLMEVDGQLQLQKGDKFYYSFKGTTPRSEEAIRNKLAGFKTDFIESWLGEIKRKEQEFWIKRYVVKRIGRSYETNYHTNPSGENNIVYEYFVKDVDSYWYMKLGTWFRRLKLKIERYAK